MKDFVKKYHKKKIIGNFGILSLSLVMAVGINLFVVDGSGLGNSLKTSIMDSNDVIPQENSDVFLEKQNNQIIIKSSKTITGVENISFSLVYNAQNIVIDEYNSTVGQVTKLGTEKSGYNNFIISTSNANIQTGDEIARINIEKTGENSTQINMLNANFKDDSGENYKLSTSGITF